MNILVSCIGRRGYLASYFREAAGSSATIIGTSNSPWTPGFKDCDKAFILPDIASEDYISRLAQLCQQEQVDLILSALDLDIARISRHLDEFRMQGITPFVVDADTSDICFDKAKTFTFLVDNGFQSPLTFTDLAMVEHQLDQGAIDFPLYVKPRFGFASHNLFVARNRTELAVFFAYAPDMIVQQKLAGTEYSFDILNDLDGNLVKLVIKQKVAMRSGETDQATTVHSQELADIAIRLSQTLRHAGPLDVDFFTDGQSASILELNPRFGGGYPIAHLAGADFPRLMVQMARNQLERPDPLDFESGVMMMKETCAFDCRQVVKNTVDLRAR